MVLQDAEVPCVFKSKALSISNVNKGEIGVYVPLVTMVNEQTKDPVMELAQQYVIKAQMPKGSDNTRIGSKAVQKYLLQHERLMIILPIVYHQDLL